MNEEPNPPATPLATPPTTPPAADPKPASDPPALAADPKPKESDVKPDWPDDWRDKFASKAKAEDREKLSRRLARFASPDNVLASYLDLERKMSQGSLKPTLADGATDEEVASFRKAWGIPEKPEEYGIAFPEGIDVTDADKADLSEFAAAAHKMHVPTAQAKGLADWYFALRAKAEQQLYDAAHELTINNRAAIKAEFGKEYDRNVRIAKADLTAVLGAPERAEALVGLTLSDGTKLGDHPEFIRYAVAQALKGADETTLVTSDLDASGKSVDDAYRAALDLKFTDPKTYHSESHQKKLATLAAAKARKKAA